MVLNAIGDIFRIAVQVTRQDDSELDRAYNAAGIPHRVRSPECLIAEGYCNPFLFKLAPWIKPRINAAQLT
jgi:hypothetical protein